MREPGPERLGGLRLGARVEQVASLARAMVGLMVWVLAGMVLLACMIVVVVVVATGQLWTGRGWIVLAGASGVGVAWMKLTQATRGK